MALNQSEYNKVYNIIFTISLSMAFIYSFLILLYSAAYRITNNFEQKQELKDRVFNGANRLSVIIISVYFMYIFNELFYIK